MNDCESKYSWRTLLGVLGILYVVLVWVRIELITDWGEMIRAYFREYYGPDGIPYGSLKWRTATGRQYQSFGLLFGTWVYPLSILLGYQFVLSAIEARNRIVRLSFGLAACLAVGILARFVSLRVFTSVSAG